MLHAALVANILNALNAKPVIIPPRMKYPGVLPGFETTVPYAFNVFLGPFWADTNNLFLKIENPHWDRSAEVQAGWKSIRDLYDAIIAELKANPRSFNGGCQLPPPDNPGAGRLVSVTSLDSAIDAITIILDQGEGQKPTPDDLTYEEDADFEVAHFYQFRTLRDYFWHGASTTTAMRTVDEEPQRGDLFASAKGRQHAFQRGLHRTGE